MEEVEEQAKTEGPEGSMQILLMEEAQEDLMEVGEEVVVSI